MAISELATCDRASIAAYAFKFAGMVGMLALHGMYLVRQQPAWPTTLAVYAVLTASFTWCTCAVRQRFYLHLHHWMVGAVLMPVCHTEYPVLSLALLGICAAQFVEGASKWSCAPLWHRRRVLVAESMVLPVTAAPKF